MVAEVPSTDDVSPCCYICTESTNARAGDLMELMAPCACRTFVHRVCLDNWRRVSTAASSATHCRTCKSAFEMEFHVNVAETARDFLSWLGRALRLTLVIIAVAMAVGLVSWKWHSLDDAEKLEKLTTCVSHAAFIPLWDACSPFIFDILGRCLATVGLAPIELLAEPIPWPIVTTFRRVRNLRPIATVNQANIASPSE
ncbi:Aste57867_20437 [Aphanomyces stellatus]|uniref:Aste57867_20437 protein n=1 Tax=Aphanomyces stellatus TaxID=120398 RepID=A0A485LEZ0_9STRA|nr:hypothetical protein As57867_020371 [Aphanomyces stellatus]VFT97123.1 Aste57867_20437 [Aphanomyces stellatus]